MAARLPQAQHVLHGEVGERALGGRGRGVALDGALLDLRLLGEEAERLARGVARLAVQPVVKVALDGREAQRVRHLPLRRQVELIEHRLLRVAPHERMEEREQPPLGRGGGRARARCSGRRREWLLDRVAPPRAVAPAVELQEGHQTMQVREAAAPHRRAAHRPPVLRAQPARHRRGLGSP